LPAYQRAADADALTLRVVAALFWEPSWDLDQIERLGEIRSASRRNLLRATSVKIWYDGVMHTHTSKLIEPYADKPQERGVSMIPVERLHDLAIGLDREGFQLHIHADGDLAVRESLDAIEAAIAANGRSDNRHHIAHLELVHPDDIDRFRLLDVVANVQPMWSTSEAYIGDLIDVKIGKERSRWLEINRSFLDHGVKVAYGSDWYVTSPNPMDLIEAAVTRIRPAMALDVKRRSSPPLPGENVSVADAIASYTINGAYVNHQDESTGSIEVGKYADLAVLDQNLFDVETLRISEVKVILTIMNGNVVHGELPLN
jgi:predicted amidohydrolase YtcJ